MDIGARLRDAREARGLTIDALSRSTRVQPKLLSAIERNDSVVLPPRPYGRGFVRAYASEVGLDPDGTVRDFFSQFGLADVARAAPPLQPSIETEPPRGRLLWLWPVAAVVGYALVGTLVILMGQWALQRHDETGAVGTADQRFRRRLLRPNARPSRNRARRFSARRLPPRRRARGQADLDHGER